MFTPVRFVLPTDRWPRSPSRKGGRALISAGAPNKQQSLHDDMRKRTSSKEFFYQGKLQG
jgi:hypothetical protein